MAVNFIRQLRLNPDTGELYIYFWQDPTGRYIKRLKLLKTERSEKEQNNKDDGSSSSSIENFMIFDGAGNRNRTGMGIATRRILSPVRLPVPPSRLFYLIGGYLIGGGTQIRTGDEGFADLCLTTWLCRHLNKKWSGRRDLNPRPSPWQGDALPLSHFRTYLVPWGGIEPPTRGFSVLCSTN